MTTLSPAPTPSKRALMSAEVRSPLSAFSLVEDGKTREDPPPIGLFQGEVASRRGAAPFDGFPLCEESSLRTLFRPARPDQIEEGPNRLSGMARSRWTGPFDKVVTWAFSLIQALAGLGEAVLDAITDFDLSWRQD